MTEQDYLLAWAAYAVAALGCLLVWCRMTRWVWRWLREPLRLVVAVLLLTPTIVEPTKELFAPAIAVIALDVLFKVGTNLWRAVADMALYGVIALMIWLAFAGLRMFVELWLGKRREAARPTEVEEDEPTLRELMARGDDGEPHDDRLRIEPRL